MSEYIFSYQDRIMGKYESEKTRIRAYFTKCLYDMVISADKTNKLFE